VNDSVWCRRAVLTDPADAAAYRQLLDAYAADPMGQGRPLPAAVLDKVVSDLASHPTAWAYLAGYDKHPRGFATCFLGYSTFRARPLLNIHDIAVEPAARGQGLARRLLRHIAAEAGAYGCCKLTLEVRDDNPLAADLYRSEGFGAAQGRSGPVQYLFLEKSL
jgi:GNAT superfamily N-acetyltransferase